MTSAAFSPDGRYLLLGTSDNSARLVDVATGVQIRSFVGHSGMIKGVAISPDGRMALTGAVDQTARLWDMATGETLRTFKDDDADISSVAFSGDGRRILTGNLMGYARLWDANSGARLLKLEDDANWGPVTALAFAPDSREAATGSARGSVTVWDLASGKARLSFHCEGGITALAYSPDGRRIVTGNADALARMWDAGTGKLVREYRGHTDSIWSIAVSPDGRYVVTGSGSNMDRAGDATARLWDAETGALLWTYSGHTAAVDAVAFAPDGRELVTASVDRTVRLLDTETGALVRTYEGRSNRIFAAVFSRDGRLLLTGSEDATARLWDLATGGVARSFQGHTGTVTSAAFSRDGSLLLTGSEDDTAKLWNTETGEAISSFQGGQKALSNGVIGVSFSPDVKRIFTGSYDQGARLWDVASGELVHDFAPALYRASAGLFLPGGERILIVGDESGATASGGVGSVWNLESGEMERKFPWHKFGIQSAALFPDGRTVLTGGEYENPKLWSTETGALVREFKGDAAGVNSVALSPDAKFAVTGGEDRTVRIWDVASGSEIRRMMHTGPVESVAFSPDGRLVVSASWDTTTRLWEAATGRELCTLITSQDGSWTVVDPEGRFDTSNLDGGAPLVWVLPDDPMRALPLEIFMRDYYTPRLLARIVNGETLPAVRSIAEIRNRVQPEVRVVSVVASKSHAGRADVVVHAASRTDEKGQASGLEDLRLFRNGQLVGYREGTLKDGDFMFADVQLPTTAKSVTFTAYAFNAERIKSATAEKEYAYEPGPARKARAWLVQIGVNHYAASGCELYGSASDAEKLSRVLTDRLSARGLDVRAVLLVSDGNGNDATKEKIRAALRAIAAEATPDDVFFMSFSGHGYSNAKGEFYMLPADAEGTCAGVNEAMLKSSIAAAELTEWLRPVDAGEMTFILDSCDSASSVEANDFKPGPMGSAGLGQLAYDKRMRILAASQPDQAARESDTLGQGLLSYALAEGLIGGEADWQPKDGKIVVGEWLKYAANAVPGMMRSGKAETGRGLVAVGAPKREVPSAQTPAVFDFSKQDGFVLEKTGTRDQGPGTRD